MRYVLWLINIIIFLIVALFAIKNTTTVPVTLLFTRFTYHLPMIIILLVAFVLGMVATGIFGIPRRWRQHRALSLLQDKYDELQVTHRVLERKHQELEQSLQPVASSVPLIEQKPKQVESGN